MRGLKEDWREDAIDAIETIETIDIGRLDIILLLVRGFDCLIFIKMLFLLTFVNLKYVFDSSMIFHVRTFKICSFYISVR